MNQSDVLNNECTGRSPCHDCPRHLQGLDKNECVTECKRLAAYRNDEPWEGLAIPTYNEHGKKEMVEMESQKKREYHKTTVQPGSVKQARGLLNEKAGGTCLIDGCGIEHNLIRGLCKKHYQAWRKGIIKHPILGEFTIWQAKNKKPEVVNLKPEVEKVETIKKVPIETIKELMSPPMRGRGLKLNLDNYPKIKGEIDRLADKFFVTPEHIVIDFISWALAARKSKV